MNDLTPKEVGCNVGAYTGTLCGKMKDLHEYLEKIMGQPIWTHQLGEKELWAKIKIAATPDFLRLAKWCSGEEVKHEVS